MDENEHRDKRQRLSAGEDRMDLDVSIAPTGHDRNNIKIESLEGGPSGLQKSERDQKFDQTGIDTLQKDFGEAFLIRKSCKALTPRYLLRNLQLYSQTIFF